MTAPISVTEDQLFTQLGSMFATLVDGPLVRGLDNRVAMPVGAFAAMTTTVLTQLSQPVQTYAIAAELPQLQTITTPMQWHVSVDCYGPFSQQWAVILATVLRSMYACENLADLQPLFASDPMQLPLVAGESQYIERWRFDAVLQYNPAVTLPQQSAIALDLDLISVDATYPPELKL